MDAALAASITELLGLGGASSDPAAWELAPLAGAEGEIRAEIVDAHLVFDAQVKVPVLVVPRGLQAMSPRPRSVPSTSATTPVVSRVSASGRKPFGVKAMPGTSIPAWPRPLSRS